MTSHKYIIVILFCLLPRITCAACTWTSTAWTSTPDYESVNACVTNANDGDTINVSAGSATWSSALIINKAVILKGGIGGTTTITGNVSSGIGFIRYSPTTPSTNNRFRLTGFTLNNGGLNHIVSLYQKTATAEYIRIDDNIINITGSYRFVYVVGTFFGVVDSNTISMDDGVVLGMYGNDRVQWDGVPRIFGDINNFYFEDNVITATSNGAMIASGGQGGRYITRYNTFQGKFDYIYDWHGNQPGGEACVSEGSTCGNASSMIIEIYGNHWNKTTSGYLNSVSDQRGGWAMFFMNKLTTITTGTSAIGVREEYADDLWPVGNYIQRPTNSYYWANWNNRTDGMVLMSANIDPIENGCADPATDWQPNHLYGAASASSDTYNQRFTNDPNKYCWKKTQYGGGMVSPYLTGSTEPDWSSVAPRYIIADGNIHWINMGAGDPIYENIDIFTQRSTGIFDGSGGSSSGGGVGCGTLANRPETCTTGVGYWATNQKCDDLTGMVGVNPSIPISGTLYKCTSTNTWEPYYTPYTYPHPLRRLGNRLSGGVVAGGTF